MRKYLKKDILIPAGAYLTDEPPEQPLTKVQQALDAYMESLPEDFFTEDAAGLFEETLSDANKMSVNPLLNVPYSMKKGFVEVPLSMLSLDDLKKELKKRNLKF